MGRSYRESDSRRYFDWLFHANLDFLAAKNLIKDTRCYNSAAFHCQQCIEKALKGYLLFKKHKLYDGHNLTWLCKQAALTDQSFTKWIGKSTLLNIIGGMDRMTSGQLTVEGHDMSDPTEAERTEYRREYVGFIFQAYNLMPNLSAYENIEFIAEISDDPMDSMEALKLVGLDAKADSMPTALSGGQMQRISIARALVKNPKIILADEPTAALDYDTSIKVLSVIEKISKENNTTILMVTHNPEIAKMANRVVKLRDGKISSIRVNLHPLKATDLVW